MTQHLERLRETPIFLIVNKNMELLKEVIRKTQEKLEDPLKIQSEYDNLKSSVPTNPHYQHDQMVSLGLCQKACKFPRQNRYCNLFPFDTNIVHLSENQYINASWMKILPWHPNR